MTPHLDDLPERTSISKNDTFGNNGQLQTTMRGVIWPTMREKGKTVKIRIKDVLWVPGLPCRFFST